MGAFKNTQSAAHAVFIDDKGLHLFGSGNFLHFNGIEVASFHTGLAALAFLSINYRPEAAGRDQVSDIGQFLKTKNDLAATGAAVAGACYLSGIGRHVN
jgi:hypothetical protein